jgi:uncharacterized protein YoxC
MISFESPALHALSLAAAVGDTIWVRQSASGFERVTSIASGVLTLIALVAVIAVVPAVWGLRRKLKAAEARFEKVNVDLKPLLTHATAIADNVNYISTAIREDVGAISGTLRAANDRLQDAIASTERQLREFNALLEVVQQEAEGVFVATAATVRGVRTGASHFAGGGGTELASVEPDDDDLGVVEDHEDTDNGNDGFTDDDPDAARGPRVIRRAPR